MDDMISLAEAQQIDPDPQPSASLLHGTSTFARRLLDGVAFLCHIALSALSLVTLVQKTPQSGAQRLMVIFYAAQFSVFTYSTLLVASSIRGKSRVPMADIQRVCLLLIVWATYAYRDIWPLASFTSTPLDADEGILLWVKVVLLTLVAIILPLVTPRRPSSDVPQWDATVRPEQTASILSLVTFSWLNPLVNHAQKVGHVTLEELPPLADYNAIEHLVSISEKYVDPLQARVGQKKRNVAWSLFRLFQRDWFIMAVMTVLASLSSFLVPLGLRHILSYLERGAAAEAIRPWFWIGALCVGYMASSLAMQYYHYVSTQIVARTQAIISQLTLDHGLRLRARAQQQQGGKGNAKGAGDMPAISNLATTDLTACTNAGTFVLLVLLETPIQVVLSVYFLYQILGWSTFVGIGVLLALMPIPERLNKRMKSHNGQKAAESDKRIKLVTQMLKNIRTIKLLGWEAEQAERVDAARESELYQARQIAYKQIQMELVKTFVPLVVMLVTYATYTLGMHRELSASIVFSSISLFDILRSQLGLFIFRRPIILNGLVSLGRINRFLQESELLDEYDQNRRPSHPPPSESGVIGIRNARFTWCKHDETKDGAFSLKIVGDLPFQTGALNLIYGPTACGKTALLLALLGEMHYVPTTDHDSYVSLPKDPRTGIGYVHQTPWITQGTVRDNIVLGSQYDERRYQEVLHDCALLTDIKQWSDGDGTVVGERGTALSGGQKARIALARAVYSRSQTIIIDDVLAALDNTTIRHIVSHCFRGRLLRGRTVIMVSNNVNAVFSLAGWVVEMGHGGVILHSGCPTELDRAAHKYDLAELVQEVETKKELTPTSTPPTKRLTRKFEKSPIVKAEEIREGHVGWGPLTLLFGNMAAYPVLYWVGFLVVLLLSGLAVNAQFWLLGDWAKQYAKKPAEEVSVPFFLVVYSALLLAATFLELAARYLYMSGSLRACKVIHKKLMGAILGTTLRWLETTPTSRVIARCTEDIGAIDGQIANSLFTLLQLTGFLVLRLVMVMIVAPVFTIGVAAVTLMGGLYTKIYMKAQLPVKREQSNTRAPMLGHLNSTIAAAVSIRAFAVQDRYRREMYTLIDRWTRASNTFYNLNRWVIVRADMLGTSFTVCLAIYLTYFAKLDASNVGFSLSMAIAFSSKIFEWVRIFNAFEVAGNSLERIEQYLDIEREEDVMGTDDLEVLADCWPRTGDLRVDNLSASYGEFDNSPEVLKGISFTAQAGERIGVVGRTGSGKSTLTLALLRCIFTNVPPKVPSKFVPNGQVVYSGRPIGSVSLSTLRKNITIIPQNPELFAGTVRQNLDPFSQYEDHELESALLSAQGLNVETGLMVEDRIRLDKTISGDDLSAGERQIIALARAIARKSKLLIMDEATSSIDHACDARIQRALRECLDTGVTVLTVAHRLPTIQDYDKVMVLDDGKMVEFDTLDTLLRNEQSYFKALVDNAPPEERETLYKVVGISASAVKVVTSNVPMPGNGSALSVHN
ncbi:P-loop containing nucleoside triphosphate hydrolase protein [Earliella scabrosa]|nr:P-loop containing nucleoside triphosphate hydrolase protein [Earliella scabrosa]